MRCYQAIWSSRTAEWLIFTFYQDASAAALFTACKVEDTLKKSKDILCTAYNRSLPVSEHLSPDDSAFEGPSRNIIGLERLMLESSTFDFRARHPQKLLIKLLKRLNIERSSPLARTAYTMSIDLYRTFAPLKQTSATMAFACLELSARVLDDASTNSLLSDLTDESQYTKWRTSRAEIMETMRDALSLFTDHRSHSTLGPTYTIDTFLNISIALKQEADAAKLPRYTYYQTRKPPAATTTNGRATNGSSRGGRHNNNRNTQPTRNQQQPPTPQNRMTPAAVIDTSALLNPSSTTQPTVPVSNPQQTIRYLLSPLAAASETAKTTAYFTVDESEYEVEEEVSAAEWAKMQAAAAAQAQAPTGPRGHGHHGHGPSRGRGGYGRGFGRGGHPGRR